VMFCTDGVLDRFSAKRRKMPLDVLGSSRAKNAQELADELLFCAVSQSNTVYPGPAADGLVFDIDDDATVLALHWAADGTLSDHE